MLRTHADGFEIEATRDVYIGEMREIASVLSARMGTPIVLDDHPFKREFTFDYLEEVRKYMKCWVEYPLDWKNNASVVPEGTVISTFLRAKDGSSLWTREELEHFSGVFAEFGFEMVTDYPSDRSLAKYVR
jgi:hypothetical protein